MTEILQYVHKDSLFHRLHPGTKVLFVLVVSLFAILSTQILALVAIFLAILLLAWISRLHKELFQQMTLIIVMSAILILITVFTMPAGPVLGYLIPTGVPLIGGSFPVTIGGLEYGVVLTLRFAILITAVQLFVISTQPRDLVHAMERIRVPPDYTLMFIIALRFIPTLQIEGKRIHEAQLARGYNPGQGFLGRIRSVAPVMIPLVSNALARSNVMGLTIDLRGYRSRIHRRHREMIMGRLDHAAIALLLVFSAFYGTILVLMFSGTMPV
jgi:energy-coupling factor transport system permease protein